VPGRGGFLNPLAVTPAPRIGAGPENFRTFCLQLEVTTMTKPASSTPNPEFNDVLESSLRAAELPWRAFGDPGSIGTLYQMGYDAWKTWADMQLSVIDACWKMGCLGLDVPTAADPQAAEDGTDAERVKLEVRLKKVSGS
jgi:hypothetical protein